MSFSPEEIAAGERLGLYNAGPITPANPYGLGQGGQRNYITAAQDLSLFGAAVVRETLALRDASTALAQQVQAAALLIQGGPVSSVKVGNAAAQTGAVVINLDELSTQIQQQLAEVQAAQAAVVTQGRKARAYSRAFGG